jgi:hypothetical protein
VPERRVRLGVRQLSGDYPRPQTPRARRHASLVRRLLRFRGLRCCGDQSRLPRRLGPAVGTGSVAGSASAGALFLEALSAI